MQIIKNIKNYKLNNSYKVLTIGNFDGLHIGHQAIISKIVRDAQSKKGESLLLTFSPHPVAILNPSCQVDLIQTEKQLINILEKNNLSTLIIENFTKEYSLLTADNFFDRIFYQLKFNKLLIGYDFKFGKDKLGNFDFLKRKSEEHQFELEKIEPSKNNNFIISSTKIREQLKLGLIEDVNDFLGRNYSVSGVVVKGEGKGAEIGFPTLNISCENNLFIKQGVYKTKALIDGKSYGAIANFGRAPTIKNELVPVLEVHILNESLNCYGKKVEIEFLKFIRPEKKFKNIEALIKQIKEDILSGT